MDKPRLGQKVSATDRLRRTFVGNELHWLRFGDVAVLHPQPVTGVYVGSRTKQNGYSDHWLGEGSVWVRKGDVQVWLIAFADREKPAFVLPEDCTFTRRKK